MLQNIQTIAYKWSRKESAKQILLCTLLAILNLQISLCETNFIYNSKDNRFPFYLFCKEQNAQNIYLDI